MSNKLFLQKKLVYRIKNIGFYELELLLTQQLLSKLDNFDDSELKFLDALLNQDAQILYDNFIIKKRIKFNSKTFLCEIFC